MRRGRDAIILLAVETFVGREMEVAEELVKAPEITEVYLVTGDFDILAKIEVERVEEALDFVMNKVRKLDGVLRTRTVFTK
ncbi:MAG TPA: Lrp/AsnC family transcriptional regulator, partial [Methanomicrobia archaeon]|nr:Lrp/AsnC family transcriptional regulator [Methanomicrobia archaeon]HEX59011.1 Lrp/AsnC family transcriptional regulator [Methanomicrobia archaeon]